MLDVNNRHSCFLGFWVVIKLENILACWTNDKDKNIVACCVSPLSLQESSWNDNMLMKNGHEIIFLNYLNNHDQFIYSFQQNPI